MTNPRTITAKSTADMLALVPQVLGFHPDDSVVLLTLGRNVGGFHARIDLPEDAEDVPEAAALLVDAVDRNRIRKVFVVAYSQDQPIARRFTSLLCDRLEGSGVDVVDVVRADGERWYSLTGCTGSCCPAEGTPYDVSSHPITAQAVLDGQVTLSSRQELEDSLVGTDPEAITAVEEAADRRMDQVTALARPPVGASDPKAVRAHLFGEGHWVRDRVRRYLSDGEPLSHDDAGRLLVATVAIEIRDVAWAEMSRDNARRHVDLWRDLLRRAPFDLMAAPAALLGFAAWLNGDGALAWCAVDRCQEVEPDYQLVTLLASTLAGAIPPSSWTPLDYDALAALAS